MSAVASLLLLDTGERLYWTPRRRVQLGQCVRCEWHLATQGHHPYCPDADYCTCPPEAAARRNHPTPCEPPTYRRPLEVS